MPTSDRQGQPPWHMWGDTKTVRARAEVGVGPDSTPVQGITHNELQFARVSYGRPETWAFLVAGLMTECSGDLGVSGEVTCNLSFDFTVGVGRSQVKIPEFRGLNWQFNGVSLAGMFLWSSTGVNRISAEGSTILGVGLPIVNNDDRPSKIVAQDIQATANLTLITSSITEVTIDVSVFFAPHTHVRPEWFIHRFNGGEERGT